MPRTSRKVAQAVPASRTTSALGVATKVTVLSPIPSPTGSLRLLKETVEAGQPVQAYLPKHQACHVSIDGGLIAPDAYPHRMLQPGEELLLKPRVEIPAAIVPFLIAGLISTAVGFGISALSALLFPAARPRFAEPDEPTYGFQGIRTTVGPGNKIPVIYGTHRVGGQLIQASVEMENTAILTSDGNNISSVNAEQRPLLNMLIALGEGEIASVTTAEIEINGQPLANFPEVTTQVAVGTPSQAALVAFSETRNTFSDGREVLSGGILYTTTQAIHGYTLTIAFNEGLVEFSSKGDPLITTVTWRFRHRVSPAGAWSSYNTVVTRAAKTSVVRLAVRREGLTSDIYDIEVEFVSVDRTITPTIRYKPFLESVTEIQNGTQAYPNTALLGLRATATENINGAIPNVTTVVSGKLVRVGSFGATPTFSRNPAWCLLDFLTNTRYGLGIPDAEINLPSFVTFAAYCDEVVDGDVRHRLDYVLVEDAEEAILQMLSPSRGSLYKFQGQWTVLAMQDDPPVQLLSWTNCSNVKLTYTRDPDRINVMEGRFADESDQYEQNVLTWPEEADWPAQVRKSTVDVRGVVRKPAVIRHLQYELNRRILPKLFLQADCALDALALTANDVFRFAHPLPGWGISGRIQSGSTTTTILLDEAVVFGAGGSYHLYVRHEDDTVETRAITHPGAGSYTTVTLASPLSQTPVALTSLYSFGESSPVDTAIREFRVMELERLTDNTIRLRGIQHNGTIYDDASPDPLPDISNLFNPNGPPPPLQNLVITEFQQVRFLVSYPVVNLSWDVAPLTPTLAPYGGAIIYRREVLRAGRLGIAILGEANLGETQAAGDPITDYVRFATVGANVFSWNDTTVVFGTAYQYKVVPVSLRNIPNNNGTLNDIIHVIGPQTSAFTPGQVTGLQIRAAGLYVEAGYVEQDYVAGSSEEAGLFEGPDLHLEWHAITTGELFKEGFFINRYRVDIWAPGQAYIMRRDFVTAPQDTSTMLQYTYTRDQNAEDQRLAGFPEPRRDMRVLVWAIATTGRESPTPAMLDASNPAPDMAHILPALSQLASGSGSIRVAWAAYVEPRDISRYDVYVDTVSTATVLNLSVGPGVKLATVSGLTLGTPYYVRIVPHDTFGVGVASQIATITPV